MAVRNPLYLGLDIGTSGVRGVCIDRQQKVVATAVASVTETHRTALRNPLNWKAMLIQVMSDLGSRIDPGKIISIAVDGQSGTVLLCNSQGEVFGNTSLLYNDNPAANTVTELTERLGLCPDTLARACELWKKMAQPQDFHIVHQADWIAGLFSGDFKHTDENNALKTGYSAANRKWRFATYKLPFNPAALPQICLPATPLARASSRFAADMGLSPQCQIVAGTTDGTAGFIAASGLHQLDAGTAVTSLGTTLIIKTVSKKEIKSARFGVYSHRFRDLWIAGGASNSGAGVLLDFFTPARLEELSQRIDPDLPGSLRYYPLLVKGERFPVNDPQKESLVTPRPEDDAEFLAALFESIAHIERQCYETLDALGAPYPKVVKTVGGGSRNKIWSKIRERVLGVDIITATQADAAYGAALIASIS